MNPKSVLAMFVVTFTLPALELAIADGPTDHRISQFVNSYCQKCHDAETREADLDLVGLSATTFPGRDYRKWQRIVVALRQEEMPPRDEKQPSPAEREQIVSHISRLLTEYARRNAGDPGRVAMRRLTKDEYNRSIRDLTGVDLRPADIFPSESAAGEGFTNAGDGQVQLSASLMQKYLQAAKDIADRAMLTPSGLTFADRPLRRPEDRYAWAEQRIRDFYERKSPDILDTLKAAYRFRFHNPNGLSLEMLAAEAGVNAVYLRQVLSVLDAESQSRLLSETGQAWTSLPADDEGKASRILDSLYRDRIQSWQKLHEAFPEIRQEQHLRIDKLPEQGDDVVCWLLVGDVGDGNKNDVVICRAIVTNAKNEAETKSLRTLLVEHHADYVAALPFGIEEEADELVFEAPAVEEIRIPHKAFTKNHRLELQCKLDRQKGTGGSVQLQLRKDKKRPAPLEGLQAGIPILAAADHDGIRDQEKALSDVLAVFPATFHQNFVGSDDLANITPHFNNGAANVIYQRRDEALKRLALTDEERHELDALWEDLLFVRKEPLFAMECYLRGKLENDAVSLIPRTAEDGMATIERLFQDPTWWEKKQKTVGQLDANREFYDVAKQRLLAYRKLYLQRLDSVSTQHLQQVLLLASRAWRRPLSADETKSLLALYQSSRQQRADEFKSGWTADTPPGLRHVLDSAEQSHRAGIQAMLVRILASPHFVFRIEQTPSGEQLLPISDWELASRLSFFLWASVPDAPLREAAEEGVLHDDKILAAQVDRMMADERADALASIFFGQWFGFYGFDQYEGPNPEMFPEFTPELRRSMHEEPLQFLSDLIRNDRSLRNIVQADYCFVDKQLADLYGLKHSGKGWQRVEHTSSSQRGGILTMASLLTRTSVAKRTSPILRGKWVYEQILGQHLPDPPDDVPPLTETAPDEKLTLRQRIEAHRSNKACASCHAKFDPLGFALERYDPIGRWRQIDAHEREIDNKAVAEDGSKIDGVSGLKAYLARQEDLLLRTLSVKLLGYALGRQVELTDEALIGRIQEALKENDWRLTSAIKTIVTSQQFRYRQAVHATNK